MNHGDDSQDRDAFINQVLSGIIDQAQSGLNEVKTKRRRIIDLTIDDGDITESISAIFVTDDGVTIESSTQTFFRLDCGCVVEPSSYWGRDLFGHTSCKDCIRTCNRCLERVALRNCRILDDVEGKRTLFCRHCGVSEHIPRQVEKMNAFLAGMSRGYSLDR